jgi:hypothetical protein
MRPLDVSTYWPDAACSLEGVQTAVTISQFPKSNDWPSLRSFLRYSAAPLSTKAATGFRNRLFASGLKYSSAFGRELDRYVKANGENSTELIPAATLA